MTIERYVVAETVAEAAQAAAEGGAAILAGGTDLMPQNKIGKVAFQPLLINIRRIAELTGIEEADGRFRLGALTTVTQLLEHPAIAARAPVLARTADCFASVQIRNAATLGGNICNASPAGDMIIPLLLLDAEVELARWSDGALRIRALPLRDFFTGPGQTRREAGEILTQIYFDIPAPGFVAGFTKFGPRPALEIAMASVGVAGRRENGSLHNARLAFGAVAPIPMRGPKTEAAIEGKTLDAAAITAAAAVAAAEVTPISDLRGSAWYRRNLVRVFTERLLHDVVDH